LRAAADLRAVAAAALLLAAGCATAPVPVQVPERPLAANITEDYARFRAAQVENVDYTLEMRLDAASTEYSGRARVEFDLARAGEPVTIDFAEGKVLSLRVNGRKLEPDYNGFFLTLPASSLKPGRQRVDIEFSRAYSTDGVGFYRWVDPEDQRVYVYTDFEPFQANRLFPLFDQPDLKATWELTVDVPADWIVVSSEPEFSVSDSGGGKRWVFNRSKRFSSYIFSLHAGPWRAWSAQAGKVPLRLLVRQSLAPHVNHEEWLRVTQQGFEFFEKYYEVPYPFTKYDQVIVPDFLSGAMENVGAVTFSERFVKRGAYTRLERENLANVVLHELAHMWFGNLVTMRWWNGLWLNESFANFMANLAEEGNTEFREAWLTYFVNDKMDAYEADEQVITHPIELPVADTDSAFANFDDITYGKGGAVLKQLSKFVGPENFRKGVSNYLKEHSWQNTELEDFMGAQARAAGRNLDGWTKEWLYTADVNTVAVEKSCAGGRLASLRLRQAAAGKGPATRTHRLQVATYDAGGTAPSSVTEVLLEGAEHAIDPLPDVACPALVYPNYDDWAFIKVQLGAAEFDFLREGLRGLPEPLTRAMLWRNLWEAVRDAKLPLSALAALAPDNLAAETEVFTTKLAIDTAARVLTRFYWFGEEFGDAAREYAANLEDLAWSKLESGQLKEDMPLVWFDFYARVAASPAALDRLAALLEGTLSVPGLELGQDRRWNALINLTEHGHAKAAALLAAEAARDPSARGKQTLLAVDAVKPDLATKQRWVETFIDDKVMTLADARTAMRAIFPASQAALGRQVQQRVLEALPQLEAEREPPYIDTYTGWLVQGWCDADSVARLEAALEKNRAASLTVTRALEVAIQDDRRCLAMKELESRRH
jgi:aminopeptidase N